MVNAETVLEYAIQFLRDRVKPRAQEIDQNPGALAEVVKLLGDHELLALKRPHAFGGPELSEPQFRRFQEEIARTSGALAFLTTQHQSAVSMISSGENSELAQEYLPKMATGEKLVGIGFSQLRRVGPSIMTATPTDGGYVLDGHVPWVTGYEFFPEFLVGATLPDRRALFAVVPLVRQEGVLVSEPMKLAAMSTANTVTVDFKGFFLPASRVAFTRPADWTRTNDMINIALQGHFAIGCAQAGIDIVEQSGERKGLDFVREAAAALQRELQACRDATAQAQSSMDLITTEERLAVRTWAIDLAVRCAHAAIAASSGAANSLSHPAQRVYREALVYTVSAQTTLIMEATLKRLTRNG